MNYSLQLADGEEAVTRGYGVYGGQGGVEAKELHLKTLELLSV